MKHPLVRPRRKLTHFLLSEARSDAVDEISEEAFDNIRASSDLEALKLGYELVTTEAVRGRMHKLQNRSSTWRNPSLPIAIANARLIYGRKVIERYFRSALHEV